MHKNTTEIFHDNDFNKGDKCFLFSNFPLCTSLYGKFPIELFPGVSIAKTPCHAINNAEGNFSTKAENVSVIAHIYPEYLIGRGVVHACIKIDANISEAQKGSLFWAAVGALIIVKPIFLSLSGAFIYGDQDKFICTPEKLNYKTNLSLDAIQQKCNFDKNFLNYDARDLELAKAILPKILNILNSGDSIPRVSYNLRMFFKLLLWENLNFESSFFSIIFPLLDSFAGNPSWNQGKSVSKIIASFLGDVTCIDGEKIFSKEEIEGRIKCIWELHRYPELHGHLKLPMMRYAFTKDLFDVFEISRLCIYKMLLLSESDFESYSKIPIPKFGLSVSDAKDDNKIRDKEASSFFDKFYENTPELISFFDFTNKLV